MTVRLRRCCAHCNKFEFVDDRGRIHRPPVERGLRGAFHLFVRLHREGVL